MAEPAGLAGPGPSLTDRLRMLRRRRLARVARQALAMGTWAASGLALAAGLAGLFASLR
jgi:hypothetical protein